ncbi:MAG: hypothetical protein DMG50_03555 [Acidobacteria bacterium]|nr:MAG: hypothetical protein DMG50_03555 [Acidobacteriota bacterium]
MTVGGGRQLCAQPRVGEAHLMGEAEDNEDREGLRDCAVLNGLLASAAPASSSAAIPARLVQPIQLGGS